MNDQHDLHRNAQAVLDWVRNFLSTANSGSIQQDFVIIDGIEFMSKITFTTRTPIPPYILAVGPKIKMSDTTRRIYRGMGVVDPELRSEQELREAEYQHLASGRYRSSMKLLGLPSGDDPFPYSETELQEMLPKYHRAIWASST